MPQAIQDEGLNLREFKCFSVNLPQAGMRPLLLSSAGNIQPLTGFPGKDVSRFDVRRIPDVICNLRRVAAVLPERTDSAHHGHSRNDLFPLKSMEIHQAEGLSR